MRRYFETSKLFFVPFALVAGAGIGCSEDNNAVGPGTTPLTTASTTAAPTMSTPVATDTGLTTTSTLPPVAPSNTDEIQVDLPEDTAKPPPDPDAGVPEAEVMTMVMEQCANTAVSAVDKTSIQPADIVIAIDTSSSMAAETEFVQTYMNQFSQQIIDSGIDVHVILIASARTTESNAAVDVAAPPVVAPTPEPEVGDGGAAIPGQGGIAGGGGGMAGGGLGGRQRFGICIAPPLGSGNCPMDEQLPAYRHVTQQVGSNDILNLIVDTFPQWKDQLRPEATKSLVVISDDNATMTPNNSAQSFTTNLQALDPALFATWTLNGIFCEADCDACTAPGTIFSELITQTSGVSGELCEQDFEPVFSRLAEQIIQDAGSEIACEWELPRPPEGQTFSVDLVDVKRTTAAGGSVEFARVAAVEDCAVNSWYFDDALNPTKILACPETCEVMQTEKGGGIDVSFSCELLAGCAATNSSAVMSDTAGCTFPLPTPPEDVILSVETINVRYETPSGFGVVLGTVANVDACAMVTGGWYFDNPEEPTTITLCPTTCGEYEAGTVTNVQALFGCEAKPAEPIRGPR